VILLIHTADQQKKKRHFDPPQAERNLLQLTLSKVLLVQVVAGPCAFADLPFAGQVMLLCYLIFTGPNIHY